MSTSQELVLPDQTATIRYDEMCRAISDAYEFDEVKHIRDKALAIEVYAKQAKNIDAESKACKIRLRAERRAGELLSEMEKAKGGRPCGYRSHDIAGSSQQTLSDIGITKTQSSRWQKLAAIPKDQFDAAVEAPDAKPTTTGILTAYQEPKVDAVDPKALWLWGRLRDFEREVLDQNPNLLMSSMLDHMKTSTLDLAPRVAAWLTRIGNHGP